ncbi:MAG: 23S rRNA (adenine(2503)-C(2))-methyltransferase RlmN [Ruminococcus sp.]|nr:23S rRNA (adenine(2503)-C(2))-methyltransferase RlmN [Ruminococcus sp.]
MERIDILSLTYEALEEEILLMGEPKFRAKQIFSWLHEKRVTEFGQMTTLSLPFRERLERKFCINRLKIVKRLASSIDDTVKYLYELSDGNYVETVWMEYHHGVSVCVSTQVGCKMGCQFCASTIAGFVRNLTPGEILLQMYEAERDMGRKIGSIVLMGIGEPLDNYDNVTAFFRILSDPRGTGLSLRHVTLSTCGIVPKIHQLAEDTSGITLSVSLHSPTDQRRSEIMPINRRYNIAQVLDACRSYMKKTGRRVTFEYAVIEGINSAQQDAAALARLLKGMQCHVNLIPVNPIAERSFHARRKTAEQFQKALESHGINATVRRTLGSDIQAACGQLRRNALEKETRR